MSRVEITVGRNSGKRSLLAGVYLRLRYGYLSSMGDVEGRTVSTPTWPRTKSMVPPRVQHYCTTLFVSRVSHRTLLVLRRALEQGTTGGRGSKAKKPTPPPFSPDLFVRRVHLLIGEVLLAAWSDPRLPSLPQEAASRVLAAVLELMQSLQVCCWCFIMCLCFSCRFFVAYTCLMMYHVLPKMIPPSLSNLHLTYMYCCFMYRAFGEPYTYTTRYIRSFSHHSC